MEKTTHQSLRSGTWQACTQCSAEFEITKEDLEFYDKVSPVFNGKKEQIPPPTLCPECRMQLRLSHSNESKLYHRKCDITGKQIISAYSQDKNLQVYDQKEWWKDSWDAKKYQQTFDPTRSFFEQYYELYRHVPLMSLMVDSNENADYVNQSGWNKACYLCFCVEYSQDLLYCRDTYYSKNSIDCYFGYNLELCYECVGCKDCQRLFFSQNCLQCSESWYLYDCNNCSHCFGCTGLRQKEYCFFNEQLSKEEYQKRMLEFTSLPYSLQHPIFTQVTEMFLQYPRREIVGQNNEEVTGNYLYHSKNVQNCFDSIDLQDCKWVTNTRGAKDCYDLNRWGHPAELSYDCLNIGERAFNLLFCHSCWNGNSNLLYCTWCMSCSHCFGCDGLRNAKYCILNKQYTQEEYETLVPHIIAEMKKLGEWGQFFPKKNSVFGYNETVADEHFPLNRDAIEKQGWHWCEDETSENYLGPQTHLPDHVIDTDESICKKILLCQVTGKPYKIIPQELKFYREMNIPIPRKCPDQRHKERMTLRNPRQLWKRTCAKCSKNIQTTYAPGRPEVVYCEDCYLQTVY